MKRNAEAVNDTISPQAQKAYLDTLADSLSLPNKPRNLLRVDDVVRKNEVGRRVRGEGWGGEWKERDKELRGDKVVWWSMEKPEHDHVIYIVIMYIALSAATVPILATCTPEPSLTSQTVVQLQAGNSLVTRASSWYMAQIGETIT